ncbi:hypothetical protein NUW58_g3848 [Xylaria curta]|uniref:Uncharacterized protein n=1 Tax=Xylaria curta TaxID=42375 RepID=A0ACC1P951_9PEZI|nr:hypothetical protein NUW58_g3848 [Xylaria curta]
MSDKQSLKSLPDEILLNIIRLVACVYANQGQYRLVLIAQDVVKLQSVSRQFLRICRDNPHWRGRCLDASTFLERVSLFRQGSDWIDEDGMPLSRAVPPEQHPLQHHSVIETIGLLATRKRKREYSRIAANWDPTFPGEKTNWYHEYIQRHGPIITNWFERPQAPKGPQGDSIDVRGIALYKPSEAENQLFAVSPVDDGSICIWDVKGSKAKKGSILSKSRPGLLGPVDGLPSVNGSTQYIDRGITECVSVDNRRHAAFFALGNNPGCRYVDAFERVLMTMSAADPAVPLTVGTFNGLYLHDYRVKYTPRQQQEEVVEPFSPRLRDLSRILNDWRPLPLYAALAQPGPQCIHHMDRPGNRGLLSDDIFVAGRFTSILHYDRRMFPSIMGSLHSGGRLCSLTSLPYPFSSLDSDLRRRLKLTEEQVIKSKNTVGDSLFLEAFIGDQHGNRIVFSDGQGYLKWMERDGFTEVRRHKIGKVEKDAHRSLFGAMPGSDDIARKVLSTRTEAENSTPNDDDILFWTGEALGLVSFSPGPSFSAEDFVESAEFSKEDTAKEERAYAERMRLALERQADEAWFVQNLGMPRS